MGVPFEALIPYGLMLTMFVVTGVGMSTFRTLRNEGKATRYSLDVWDRQMMERDWRLTGSRRGQIDAAEAPAGFGVNSKWKTEKQIY